MVPIYSSHTPSGFVVCTSARGSGCINEPKISLVVVKVVVVVGGIVNIVVGGNVAVVNVAVVNVEVVMTSVVIVDVEGAGAARPSPVKIPRPTSKA